MNNQQSALAQRKMGLPWSPELVDRTLISPNGTLLAANLALENGIACHLAGGTHHAHYNYASGYCIFNDLAITARYLVNTNKARRVLIFDCDVHQGDGTASILKDDDKVFTCSIHCEDNFPLKKPASDLDVALKAGVTDEVYLQVVKATLNKAIMQSKPELIIYDAGIDILAEDALGKMAVSLQGLREREYQVLNIVKSHAIPIATVIGGGYHSNQLELAKRHALVIEQANHLFG